MSASSEEDVKYDYLTLHHDLPDQPDWMACEVGDDLWVTRMIEHFKDGRTEFMQGEDVILDQAFDLGGMVLDDPTMPLTEISSNRFQSLWDVRFRQL